jgi:multiple sugar transport system ATP-binding protein
MDLRLENLSKRFGTRVAVDIPSLAITRGEFFTFVGPSGCGKSTTLNLIAGLEAPSAGNLWMDGRLLNDLPPHRRDIAFVFQSYALYPHRTVAENLAFPLEIAKLPKPEIGARVREAASSLGLEALLDKYPRQLSGGERQRVALGRAIVRHPRLFLFDEPLSNLDAPLRAHMRRELRRLHQRLRTTFLYVTHDQEEALSLSDRIAVMKEGRVQQCATPEEIYSRPANLFVASFFGTPAMNFLHGTVRAQAQQAWLDFEGGSVKLPLGDRAVTAGEIVVGIRPEDLRVSRESAEGSLQTEVRSLELHGSQHYLELAAGGQVLTALASSQKSFRSEETLWVTPGRVHFFDPNGGERTGP